MAITNSDLLEWDSDHKQIRITADWLANLVLKIDGLSDSTVIQMHLINVDRGRWLSVNGNELERLGYDRVKRGGVGG